ncbi:MAG: carbamoyltransferase family protein [Pseudonocardia sp.]
MAVLGISGLFATEHDDYDPATFFAFFHDAAACLVDGGRTLAAIEEERLSRDKHTNRFPGRAARACLDIAGLTPAAVTEIAYFFEEEFTDRDLARVAHGDPEMPLRPVRDLLHDRLRTALGADLADVPVTFVPHHLAHAASAFHDSGMRSALVVVMDGNGERDGISVYRGDGNGLERLHGYPRSVSVGHFYTAVTNAVGYRVFDEYKVMGLASFGNPSRFRTLFEELYELGPDGSYELSCHRVPDLLFDAGLRPRRSTDPITETHRDLAAAAQEVAERVGVHVITHWLLHTGEVDLCLAGGVAQNTSLNGKLLAVPGLRRVYVPPAAHDAGAALGAAMVVDRVRPGRTAGPAGARPYSADAYLGTSLGTDADIAGRLAAWSAFVRAERPDDLERTVAAALADGAVVGWADGRAEFGPRALGRRSILADPRPDSQRDRVNKMIKKREDYRPFAPIVTAGAAARYFDLPAGSAVDADHGHMSFVVPVRDGVGLGAVTHVDGTARVQALRPEQNPRMHRLLEEFAAVAGVPVLLNTSFNNHAEPIVDSVDDAVATFVTTGLSLLVVGPFLVTRLPDEDAALSAAGLELQPFCRIAVETDRHRESHEVYRTAQPTQRKRISPAAADLIRKGRRISGTDLGEPERSALVAEIRRLWDDRYIRVVPG